MSTEELLAAIQASLGQQSTIARDVLEDILRTLNIGHHIVQCQKSQC